MNEFAVLGTTATTDASVIGISAAPRPKNGWPKKGVREAASGATHVLDGAKVFATLPDAIADLQCLLATTARERGQMKRVFAPEPAMAEVAGRWS